MASVPLKLQKQNLRPAQACVQTDPQGKQIMFNFTAEVCSAGKISDNVIKQGQFGILTGY